jgi:Flp pilus assembly protein TadG
MRLHSDVRGTAIVEFAILLPVILALLVGILSFGLYFGAAHSVQQLAADAARRTVAGETLAERTALATDFVNANAASYFLIRPDRLSQVSTTALAGSQLRVRIAYDASWLPIFSFRQILPLPDSTITRDCVILEAAA